MALLSPVRIQVFAAILRSIQTLYCPYITSVKDERRVTPDAAANVTVPVPTFTTSIESPIKIFGAVESDGTVRVVEAEVFIKWHEFASDARKV